MSPRHLKVLPAIALSLFSTSALALGSCDSFQLSLRFEVRELLDCIKELQSKSALQQSSISALEADNRVLEGFICLIAVDLKKMNAEAGMAEFIADVCPPKNRRRVNPSKK
jgi:hypothetical protein